MKVFILMLVIVSILLIAIPFIAALRKLFKSRISLDRKFIWAFVILFLPFFGPIFFLGNDD